MTFNSLHFAAFFAVVLGVVALLRDRVRVRQRNLFLLAASWYFYGAWDVRFLALLIASSIVDFNLGLGLERLDVAGDERRRRRLVIASVAMNLGVLGFFKYFNFFADGAVTLLNGIGVHASPLTLRVILPVGVSFYTFQSISYIVDVYRRQARAERDYWQYALFVSFFPQLVAGPIERSTHLMPQFAALSAITRERLGTGAWLIAVGLFKKVVLADNVSQVADAVFDARQHSPDAFSAIVGTYAFAVQIFCDFSGYTDIARGAARCMGFDLMRNFDLPYFATNPADFWRRWHISLSMWLRDYLYIPLGGNRRGGVVTYRNLMLTMLLGGLWHGAAWTFVLWGLYHGLLLCVHRAWVGWRGRRDNVVGLGWTTLQTVVFFQFTCVGWLLFRANTMENLGRICAGVTGRAPGVRDLDARLVTIFLATSIPLLIGQLVVAATRDYHVVFRLPVVLRAATYAFLFLAFVIFGEFSGGRFIYFQF